MGKRKEAGKEIPVKFIGEGEEEGKKGENATETAAQQLLLSKGGTEAALPEAGDGGGLEVVAVSPAAPESAEQAREQEQELTVPGLLGDIAELTQALNDAREQIDALTREKSTLYDQVLRRQAELENSRKRLERDKTEYYQRTRAEVLLELLPVLDNFDRALASLEVSEGDAEALRHGVELIHKQLKGALTKLGLQPVEAVGLTFDPNLHEAVGVEATDEHAENTVIEEIERGYKLGDRLLRPAKVRVAASPDR